MVLPSCLSSLHLSKEYSKLEVRTLGPEKPIYLFKIRRIRSNQPKDGEHYVLQD